MAYDAPEVHLKAAKEAFDSLGHPVSSSLPEELAKTGHTVTVAMDVVLPTQEEIIVPSFRFHSAKQGSSLVANLK